MTATLRCAAGYMLENPSIPSYSSTHLVDSDNARVRKTSRKPETPVSADPQRPYAGPLHERMRWSEPYGDVGRLTEMISPSIVKLRSNVTIIKSEIPCRVSSDLHEWRNDFSAVSTTDSAKLHYE